MTTAVATRFATPELVTHLVSEVLRQDAVRRLTGPTVIGVRAVPRWDYGSLTVDSHEVTVVPCTSPLAMRAALAERLPEPDRALAASTLGPVLVLLTDVAATDLGDDLLARLVRPKLFGLDVWQVVRTRLGVRRLDPALGDPDHRWLAEALLDVPADPGGRHATLSIDRAVDLVAAGVLGLHHVSLEQLLLATTDSEALARFSVAPAPVREGLARELAHRYGPVGALVMGAIVLGNGADVLPIGLAGRALVGSVAGSYGLGKFEAHTGVSAPDDAAIEALAIAAELALVEVDVIRPTAIDDVLTRADVWARDLQAPHPGASTVLRAGFEARIAALGEAVSAVAAAAANGDGSSVTDELVTGLRRAVADLHAHRDARRPNGVTRADGAVLAARLALWLATPPAPAPADLAIAASNYLDNGAWVDWARRRVFAGDSNAALAAAQQAVGQAADQRRATENRSFAERLAHQTAHEVPGQAVGAATPVEAVLDDVVAALAKTVPVLLVILDGCGLPAFLELAGQFRSRGMLEHGRDGRRRMGLAALPTVTLVSRMSMLAGRLMTGQQTDEKREFAANPVLAKLGGPAPVVYHASDLRSEAGAPLPSSVRTALGPQGPRVVAAVVNTIDDQLSRGTFTAAHRIEDLGTLPWLLADALDNGRAVVVTADHGHVLGVGLDGQGATAVGGTGGERWRFADREPSDDEVLLRGPRVLLGDERGVLAPWHDVLRYAGWHAGYHGGATPDEVLVPLSVYLPAGLDPPAGWEQVVAPAPAWWDLALAAGVEVDPTPAPAKRTKKAAPAGQGALFEGVPAAASVPEAAATRPAGPPWIDDLLASDTYTVQLGALGRGKPPADRVRATLIALAERGGVASFTTIAAATGMPLQRVVGFLASLTRILNVDGYGVLNIDQTGSEARLDEVLARTQFLDTP